MSAAGWFIFGLVVGLVVGAKLVDRYVARELNKIVAETKARRFGL